MRIKAIDALRLQLFGEFRVLDLPPHLPPPPPGLGAADVFPFGQANHRCTPLPRFKDLLEPHQRVGRICHRGANLSVCVGVGGGLAMDVEPGIVNK